MLRDHVDWQNGLISPAIHFDEEIYRAESDKVFSKSWLVVGHTDMLRKPGDYVTNYMGETPIIVTRGRDNDFNVLVNKCAHRGNQVCLFDRGNVRGFTCSYHGWSYGLDGSFRGAPSEKQVYPDGAVEPSAWGLERAPRVAELHGLIFASFDADAPNLRDELGDDVLWWLENIVLAAPLGGLEALPGWHRYVSPGNWKYASENFIGDTYHVFSATHVAWLKVLSDFQSAGTSPALTHFPSIKEVKTPYEATVSAPGGPPLGLGMVVTSDEVHRRDLEEARTLGREAVEWVRHRRHVMETAFSDRPVLPSAFMNGLLFPNFGLMGYISPMMGRHHLLFHPRGVNEHETWQWTMVERDAPQSVKDIGVQRVYQMQHMAGVIAPDDVENFERIVAAGEAQRNWQRPYNYRLQQGRESAGPANVPGQLSPNPSEVNQRQFYRHWLNLMERD